MRWYSDASKAPRHPRRARRAAPLGLTVAVRSCATRPYRAAVSSAGGTWPRAMPGIGRELTPEQELACALRILAAEGWEENLSGHITVACADGSLLVNPWGLW